MNILIVENDLNFLEVLKNALPRFFPEAKIATFTGVNAAITEMEILVREGSSEHPAVIISDFHLDDGTGDQILGRAATLFPHTKLILMSGEADTSDVVKTEVETRRPCYFLLKPFSLHELADCIRI